MTNTNVGVIGRTDDASGDAYPQAAPVRVQQRRSTETKSSFKTTELIVYVAAVIGVLVASYLVKTTTGHADFFRADKAWFYIVLLTIGYMGSRGLAKSGSREHYDA
jgi:hypothetical protein